MADSIAAAAQGFDADAFRAALREINAEKAKASEYVSAAGAATKNAVDRLNLNTTALTVTAGLHTHPMATLKLEVDGEAHEGMAVGDGAVDATFNAIRAAFPHEVGLRLFAVQSVTGGTDAQARVTVRLEEGGKLVDGQGSDTDTIVASARAYIHALNKLLVKRERTAPAAMTA